jgi:hypothetical protein
MDLIKAQLDRGISTKKVDLNLLDLLHTFNKIGHIFESLERPVDDFDFLEKAPIVIHVTIGLAHELHTWVALTSIY